MISSAKTAAPVSNNAPGVNAPAAPAAAATPFDAILALETVAATPTAMSAAAAELTASLHVEANSDDLAGGLTGGPDAEADDGHDANESDPLAILAALLAYPAIAPTSTSTAGSDGGAKDDALDGIKDAIASAGKQLGRAAADTTAGSPSTVSADPGNADTATAADPKAVDASLASKFMDATAASALASNDVSADTPRGLDASATARAAEMLAHGPRHAAATEQATIATPVRDPRWADDFSTRIAMMVRGGESSASLQLTPVDLGPMEVNITVRDSQASIQFGAAHAETRALIENSIPQLREMLAAQGFQLMDASVSQGFTRQTRPEIPGVSRGQVDAEPEVAAVSARITLEGLLDTYA